MEWVLGPVGAIFGVAFLYLLFIVFFGFRRKRPPAGAQKRSTDSLESHPRTLSGPNHSTYPVATPDAAIHALNQPDSLSQLALIQDRHQLLLTHGQTYLDYNTAGLDRIPLFFVSPQDTLEQEAFGQTGYPLGLMFKLEPEGNRLAVVSRAGTIGFVPDPLGRDLIGRIKSGQPYVALNVWTVDAGVTPLIAISTPEVLQRLRQK